MLACSRSSRLYEVPAHYGHISALAHDTPCVYMGTSEGWLLRVEIGVEDLPTTTDINTDTAIDPSSSSSLHLPMDDAAERSASVRVRAKEHGASQLPALAYTADGKAICQLELCDGSKPLLYVLTSSMSLTVWDATELRYLGAVQQSGALRFSILSPRQLCILNEGGTSVTILDVVSNSVGEGEHSEHLQISESAQLSLQEDEAATTVMASNGLVCVNTRRGYSFFSLSNRSSLGETVLLSGSANNFEDTAASYSPRILPCGEQILLGRGQTDVVAVDISTGSTTQNEVLPPHVTGTFRVTEGTVQAFTVVFPFLFVFTQSRCHIFSLLDPSSSSSSSSCQELTSVKNITVAVPFSLAGTTMRFVAAASGQSLWALHLYSLPYLLAQLVQSDRVKEASTCLSHIAAHDDAHQYQEDYLLPLQTAVEVATGWVLLRAGKVTDAMGCFQSRLDPRSLLRLLPECLPLDSALYSDAVIDLLQHGKRHKPNCGVSVVLRGSDGRIIEGGEEACTCAEKVASGAAAAPVDYWDAWYEADTACRPERLLESWTQLCHQLCAAASSSHAGKEGSSVCPYLSEFVSDLYNQLKVSVYAYCKMHYKSGNPHAQEGQEKVWAPQRRAVAYALLVCSLERGDHRAVYDLVCNSDALAVADSYDLLAQLGQYRLLGLLLFRRGYWQEAQTILQNQVYLSRYALSSPYRQDLLTTSGMPRAVALSALGEKWSAATSQDAAPHLSGSPSLRMLSVPMQEKVLSILRDAATRQMSGRTTCTASLVCEDPRDGDVVVHFPHIGPYRAHAQHDLLPSGFAEIFYLVEQLDLPALAQLLAADPAAATIQDEEGATLLHVALEWCGALQPNARAVIAPLPTAGVLQSVAALTSLLLAHGCASHLPTLYGLWPLDVVSINRSTARVGEQKSFDPVLEFVASVLVSQKEIIHCCLIV